MFADKVLWSFLDNQPESF